MMQPGMPMGVRPPMQGPPMQGPPMQGPPMQGPPRQGGMPAPTPDTQYSSAFQLLINGPSYKQQDEEEKKSSIGDFIYNYIVKLSSEEDAPKITGMIIDLPEHDLIDAVKTLPGLREKVAEGKNLLASEEQEG